MSELLWITHLQAAVVGVALGVAGSALVRAWASDTEHGPALLAEGLFAGVLIGVCVACLMWFPVHP